MKRSEAINVIHDKIVDLVCEVSPIFPLLREVSLEDAEGILEKLEQAGMLPPTGKLNKLGLSDNSWEPEDE